MKTLHRIVFSIAFASILLSTGCVKLWQKNLDIKTYMVVAERHAPVLEKPLAAKLWVEPVTVLPPYNMRNLVIRKSDVEFTTSYYTELLITPAENFRNALFTWFSSSGIFSAVSMGERAGLTHRLAMTVVDYYGNETEKTVVLKIKITLFDEQTKGMKVLFSKEYFEQVGLSEINADELIRTYNAALAKILSDCEQDVVAALR